MDQPEPGHYGWASTESQWQTGAFRYFDMNTSGSGLYAGNKHNQNYIVRHMSSPPDKSRTVSRLFRKPAI